MKRLFALEKWHLKINIFIIIIMCLDDFCGHLCWQIDEFDGVHGWHAVCHWNLD